MLSYINLTEKSYPGNPLTFFYRNPNTKTPKVKRYRKRQLGLPNFYKQESPFYSIRLAQISSQTCSDMDGLATSPLFHNN